MFHSWASLGSDVHVTKAEIKAAYKVCVDLMQTLGCKIAALSVDNAAKAVAEEVSKELNLKNDMIVLTLR